MDFQQFPAFAGAGQLPDLTPVAEDLGVPLAPGH